MRPSPMLVSSKGAGCGGVAGPRGRVVGAASAAAGCRFTLVCKRQLRPAPRRERYYGVACLLFSPKLSWSDWQQWLWCVNRAANWTSVALAAQKPRQQGKGAGWQLVRVDAVVDVVGAIGAAPCAGPPCLADADKVTK